MLGYYKRPELNAETIIDGWLHTGDIGVLEDGKYLKITDRKIELFKTSGGKYVAPSPIENKMKESPFVEQMIIIGAEQKFVGALIVPSFPSLQEWMRHKDIPFMRLLRFFLNYVLFYHSPVLQAVRRRHRYLHL